MNVVRSLERRLERLFEGVIGRVFSGRLHPSEIAGRLAREADFARFDHATGSATANAFTLTFNPSDLQEDRGELASVLASEMSAYAAEHGLRMEGPTSVSIETDDRVPPGQMTCHVEVVPGPPTPWARLVNSADALSIGRNRVLIGRSPDADVIIDDPGISREHALIWREGGAFFIRDLGSSNGTYVDGIRLGDEAVVVEHGSSVSFSQQVFRFLSSDA